MDRRLAAFGRSFLTCLKERLYGRGVDNWQGDWIKSMGARRDRGPL